MYDLIKVGHIKIGNNVSKDAKDLIRGMMQRSAADRLTMRDIKRHPFFATINWHEVYDLRFEGLIAIEKEDSEDQNSADWNNDYEEEV